MIRWQFVISRLLIVIVIVVIISWGLGPVAQYATVRGIESGTGAKVEIAQTTVGLFPPAVRYQDVRIADPREGKEFENVFRADSIDLVIDGDALLHRRWVAREGRIDGLQIGSTRESSGHLDEEHPPSSSDLDSPSLLSKLLGSATSGLGDQAGAIVNELETARRSKLIKTQWEAQYKDLANRAQQLELRIRGIRDTARDFDNPLRDLPELERTLASFKQAKQELAEVRALLNSLPQRLEQDLASLDEAKQIDLRKVQQYLPENAQQSDDLGVDMLAAVVRHQIDRIRGYLDSGRTIANYTVVAPENARDFGIDVDLTGNKSLPDVLIRRCEVNGQMSVNGQRYDVAGVLENLTPQPSLLIEPTRAMLSLKGPDTVQVEFTRDRRAGNDTDLLTLHWPASIAKSMRLGDDVNANIAVDGGKRELWIQLRTIGDKIDGRLVSRQTDLQMNLNVAPKHADQPLVTSLRESLAGVNRLDIDARFAGTWDDLDMNLSSNIGEIIGRATKNAVAEQVRASKQQLAAKVENAHLQHTLELREWLSKQQFEAQSLVASADKTIEEMNAKVLKEVGNAETYLGRGLQDIFRGRLR